MRKFASTSVTHWSASRRGVNVSCRRMLYQSQACAKYLPTSLTFLTLPGGPAHEQPEGPCQRLLSGDVVGVAWIQSAVPVMVRPHQYISVQSLLVISCMFEAIEWKKWGWWLVMIGSFQWQPVVPSGYTVYTDIYSVFTQTTNRIMVLGCSWYLQDGVHIVVAKHFHLPLWRTEFASPNGCGFKPRTCHQI